MRPAGLLVGMGSFTAVSCSVRGWVAGFVGPNLERERTGLPDDEFSGVPVFQLQFSYPHSCFFQEDLEKSLSRASREQHKLNPAFRQGDIEVAVFEEILKCLKEGSTTTWDDVVFIPPGFDVSTTIPK
ncbi:hypothetical protein SADUNF_Sadunf14G0110300 [Salix dunnii]|uniref:Uncharacterized protein n=1 Tax=Salix dunnii TaxID=1413687 RepID=A0A835JJD7_9ROSI|nr:hypothetical protein SADUNF_Sadunf14G0110300 [Salix dunnii]